LRLHQDRITSDQLARAVQKALKEMTFEELACLWLIAIMDQPHSFVAEMFDTSNRNISRWYRRALTKIRKALEETP